MYRQTSLFSPALSTLSSSVLRSLAYSEVFSYPLTLPEICRSLDVDCSGLPALKDELEELKLSGMVFQFDKFYSLSPDFKNVTIRLERNKRAEKHLRLAEIISRFIGNFPFVRAVFISGSLSKNSMDSESDIDYFIITETGKLWLCRTMLIVFKKIFLLNSYKYFCLNYFMDSSNLVVKDRNLYVAHEISTLIPTYGRHFGREFFNSNTWIKEYLPNSIVPEVNKTREHNIRGMKWLSEKMLNNRVGNFLNRFFYETTRKYWMKKFNSSGKLALSDFARIEDNISTLHPDNFKHRILERRSEILSDLENKFGLLLSSE